MAKHKNKHHTVMVLAPKTNQWSLLWQWPLLCAFCVTVMVIVKFVFLCHCHGHCYGLLSCKNQRWCHVVVIVMVIVVVQTNKQTNNNETNIVKLQHGYSNYLPNKPTITTTTSIIFANKPTISNPTHKSYKKDQHNAWPHLHRQEFPE